MVIQDLDITKELTIGQLIETTNNNPDAKMWERTDFDTYSIYFYSKNIDKSKNLNFRIYHWKTHDNHTIAIFMDGNEGSNYTTIMSIQGDRVFELIALIKILKNYHYKNEILQG